MLLFFHVNFKGNRFAEVVLCCCFPVGLKGNQFYLLLEMFPFFS